MPIATRRWTTPPRRRTRTVPQVAISSAVFITRESSAAGAWSARNSPTDSFATCFCTSAAFAVMSAARPCQDLRERRR